MGLETGTFIDDLVETNPVGTSDFVSQGDNHIRLIKSTIKNSFPNISGEMSRSHTQLNNAPDKTVPESITGQWNFDADIDFNNPVTINNSLSVLTGGVLVAASTPAYNIRETDAGADAKMARFSSSGGQVEMRLLNDDGSVGDAILVASRSGSLIDTTNFNGTVTYNGREVGYRNAPRTTSLDEGTVTAVSSSFTLPTASQSVVYGIYNDSASSITVSQGAGLTLRLGGSSSTGDRTLAPRTLAAVWYNTFDEAVMSGLGVT